MLVIVGPGCTGRRLRWTAEAALHEASRSYMATQRLETGRATGPSLIPSQPARSALDGRQQ
jgi:hypothetical protein